MAIEIIRVVNPTGLYGRYDGQTQEQPAYIELDLEDKTLSADWNGEIGNAVPMDVWHGLRRRYHIPCLVADEANALMEEIAPLCERVVAGSEIVWDGNNWVAKLNEDAEDAEMEIDRMCEQAEGETVSEWEASDFFGEETDENLGVKIGMDINAAADILREKYPEDDYSNPIVILHLENFLENRLEELKEKIESAAEAGDDWMLEAITDGSIGEWKSINRADFDQALSNANAPAFPTFDTSEEVDAAYDAAWERLQREITGFSEGSAAYKEYQKGEY